MRRERKPAREAGRSFRARRTVRRGRGARERAARRDDAARQRDLAAQSRDEAAEAFEKAVGGDGMFQGGFAGALRALAEVRSRAWTDRTQAARDREQAARDREEAARDREDAQAELRDAYLDDLTGVYRRGMGEVALQHEIDRSRRANGRLVLAFVDVDGLKEINDSEGHAAGDALLCDTVGAIRASLRSFDPIVRFGGDEFVCALADATVDDARARFQEIRERLAETQEHGISVGFAELRPEDTLQELEVRGDAELYAAKNSR